MFAKLLLIILAAGAIAAALLVNRQHRIDTAHEITSLHQRLTAKEQTLWKLEAEIARRLRPEEIRRELERIGGDWVALPAPPTKQRAKEPANERLAEQRRRDRREQYEEFGG